MKLEEVRESFDITERYRRAGRDVPPVEGGARMSALAIFLHAWRLRRIRRAMREFRLSVEAYETAYRRPPFPPADRA